MSVAADAVVMIVAVVAIAGLVAARSVNAV